MRMTTLGTAFCVTTALVVVALQNQQSVEAAEDPVPAAAASELTTVRVAAVQAARRLVDWRLEDPAQVLAAPASNLNHRYWKCQTGPMLEARERWATEKDRQIEAECDVSGHPAWERGMIPRPSLPMTKVASEESFR